MSGRVGDLSAVQATALQTFKENIKDVLKPSHDDYYLLCWLRARNFDLKKSEEMFRNDVSWRKKTGADTILESYMIPEIVSKYLTGGHCGYDKLGNPIWIDPFGRIDIKGILRSVKKSDVIKTQVHRFEKLRDVHIEQTEKLGHKVDEVIVIYDLEYLGMKHLWKPGVDVFCEIVDMFEWHYPETLKLVFVINAPRFFPIAYNIVKPFLSEATASKVRIFGTSNYSSALLQYIDADQLPKVYGGTRTDPPGDPRCSALVCQGGDVPKDFYSKVSINSLDMEKYTAVTIGRGSSIQVDLTVNEPDSAIRWQFITEGYDLGFGVYKRTKDSRQKANDMEQVIPSQRVNSHIFPEDGSVIIQEPGTYVVRFDNTYSWTRSKKIYYIIEMLEPDTEDEFELASESPTGC
ncbi:SEC14-like protein 2 [Ylistrum balloti]|uniref:SEC14-like protein 2 n=1 Tax=Ylistrum balloti TaxID=509963 RepID=UPI002905EA3A|nr:SEC14-like protein 2 [Ylistrum balloti]